MNEDRKSTPPDLQELRDRIGACDREILDLLKKRLDIAAQLTPIKLERALPFRDTAREDQVLEGVRSLAAARGLGRAGGPPGGPPNPPPCTHSPSVASLIDPGLTPPPGVTAALTRVWRRRSRWPGSPP